MGNCIASKYIEIFSLQIYPKNRSNDTVTKNSSCNSSIIKKDKNYYLLAIKAANITINQLTNKMSFSFGVWSWVSENLIKNSNSQQYFDCSSGFAIARSILISGKNSSIDELISSQSSNLKTRSSEGWWTLPGVPTTQHYFCKYQRWGCLVWSTCYGPPATSYTTSTWWNCLKIGGKLVAGLRARRESRSKG